MTLLNRIIERGLVQDGRLIRLRIHLLDRPGARPELERYPRHRISRVVWAEVLAGEPPESRATVAELLDPFEVACVRAHPGWAEPVMRQEWGRRPPSLYVDVALQHHERCNGSGYPRRLHGYQIRNEARAVAVGDIFEARTTRTDRGALAPAATIGWLARRAPLYVDAAYVRALAERLTLDAGVGGMISGAS